jgi:hypothetical protein
VRRGAVGRVGSARRLRRTSLGAYTPDISSASNTQKEAARRGIPRKVLDFLLQQPQQTVPERRGRRAYQSQVDFHGKIFIVRAIVDESVDPARVLTAYRTSKVNKYWRAT